MTKHLNSCIDNDTGEPIQCLLPVGSEYISCKDGKGDDTGKCEILEPCENENAYNVCNDNDEECVASNNEIKWCRQYTIETAGEALDTMIVDEIINNANTNDNDSSNSTNSTTTAGNNETLPPVIPIITTPTRLKDGPTSGRGFVPLTNMCMNHKGQFSQIPNTIVDPLGETRDVNPKVNPDELVTCTYENGNIVNRQLEGNYAACGSGTTSSSSESCDTVFAGGYQSWEYDPRYRPWYIETKKLQKSIWLKPFPFFTLGIGVTYATPIYSTDPTDGKQIFEGVLAVDYRCKCIYSFLY